jgi:hypothetical protein
MSVVQMFKTSLPPIKTRFGHSESPSNSSYNSPRLIKKVDPIDPMNAPKFVILTRSYENFDFKIGQLRSHAIIYARAHGITVSEAIQHLSKIMK